MLREDRGGSGTRGLAPSAYLALFAQHVPAAQLLSHLPALGSIKAEDQGRRLDSGEILFNVEQLLSREVGLAQLQE